MAYFCQRHPHRRTRTGYCLLHHRRLDGIIHYRETVVPTLQRIVHVTVNHHVMGQFTQVHPLVFRHFESLPDITVEDFHFVVHASLDAFCHNL